MFSNGVLTHTECQILQIGDSSLPVIKNARIFKNNDGNILGAVETITDISSLRKTQNRLSELENHIKKHAGVGKIVGKSHVIQELFNLIEFAAASNATILITGETGTGKELAAAAIHENGARKEDGFFKINCSSLPETLLESELFGHAKGSFTGAIRDKK